MTTRPWFRPKRSGYGAYPVTWQGWAVTLGLVLLMVGCITQAMMILTARKDDITGPLALCAVVALAAFAALVSVVRAKTEDPLRWRR